MRVAIMCDVPDQFTGLEVYTNDLVKYACSLEHESVFPVHRKHSKTISEHDILLPTFPKIMGASLVRNTILLPIILKKHGIDIVHYPTQSHFSSLCPLGIKQVLTIHDTLPLIMPNNFPKYLVYQFKTLWPILIQKIDKIIAVSESTKRDVMKYYGIGEEKIIVVHEGVGDEFKPLSESEMADMKYAFGFPFILYVGTLEPRKNIPTIIRAFLKLKEAGYAHKLVICGKKGWMFDEIFNLVSELALKTDVIFTGYIPKNDLVKLYNAADLFVYPSLYEGFGLPPLEAMACGTPVITSNHSSLPEVVGNSGIMVEPNDIQGLSNAMIKFLTDKDFRQDMIRLGLERVKLFSPKQSVINTLQVYRDVLKRN